MSTSDLSNHAQPAEGDIDLSKDKQDFLVYQVTEAAKEMVFSWAKWGLGVCAAILAIFGVQYQVSLRQVDEKIESAVTKRLDKILEDKSAEVDRLSQKMVDKHIDSLTTTQAESAKVIETLRKEASKELSELQGEVVAIKSRLDASEREVESRKSVIIASWERSLPPSLSAATKPSEASTVIEISGAGPGEMLVDAQLSTGRYGSPFLYFLLEALQQPATDINSDKAISLREAVLSASIAMKKTSQHAQNPTINGPDLDAAFIYPEPMAKREAASGRIFAVCVGINQYEAPVSLNGCVPDAKALVDFIKKQDSIKLGSIDALLDKAATREAIISATRKIASEAVAGDTILLSLSGHVTSSSVSKEGSPQKRAFLSVDYSEGNPIEQAYVEIDVLLAELRQSKASRKIFMTP